MNKTNANDLAFSQTRYAISTDANRYPNTGLTKREYFAAMAMQGMSASTFWSENFTDKEGDLQKVIEIAVKAADAIIEELNKTKEA